MTLSARAPPAPAPVPKLFIERQTASGNTSVPLIPVDQLPYQLQGVYSRLSQRDIRDQGWQFITEVRDTAVILPVIPSSNGSTVAQKYRAPDHNVITETAIQMSAMDNESGLLVPPTPVSTMALDFEKKHEQHDNMKDQDDGDEPEPKTPFTPHTETSPIDNPSHMKVDNVSTDNHEPHSSIERKPSAPTPNPINEIRKSGQDNDHTQAYQNAGRSTTSRGSGFKMSTESRIDNSHESFSDIETERVAKKTFQNNNTEPLRSHNTLTQPQPRVKKYCTHWIRTSECLWGEICKYKHVMPDLNILRQETGLRGYPQWWKDQRAIRPLGQETWMESRIRALRENNAVREDGSDVESAPREFPDPSTLRSPPRAQETWIESRVRAQEANNSGPSDAPKKPSICRVPDHTILKSPYQKSDAIVKQELSAKDVSPLSSPAPLSIDIESPTTPISPTSSTVPVSAAIETPAPAVPTVPKAASSEEKNVAMTTLRRHSQISQRSWSTDTTDSSPSVKRAKNKQKDTQRANDKNGKQPVVLQPAPLPKKKGFASSKWAPKENEDGRAKVAPNKNDNGRLKSARGRKLVRDDDLSPQ
ncbi:hypothetical protein BU23DRAFT_550626 [Bimuria novae-zelandiae CBS 107.79]|uniref:C3H1-type domain-containing protein n=1 Tax=Bimuria novae-zelandiae CBS 107.79 TaxID=1447943 RepID=A0A6A5VJ93_9PLEO|nr:hypothetical protein BU23DRAFT_550626 [Bimuria novae-zelandiae CBS 107.79]